MTTNRIFSVEELVVINEKMLGRGMPVVDDGVGYNKADYGACSNYYWGMSNAQVADLAKRLVKYCETQLGLDKKQMKDTYEYYKEFVNGQDRTDGVSVNVTENGTLIGFKYNERFIFTIKQQPKRQFDLDNKQWIVPNGNAVKTLEALAEVGADVENAIEYVKNHELVKKAEPKKEVINCEAGEEYTTIKFNYNPSIIVKVKELSDRKYDPQNKAWKIQTSSLDFLKKELKDCEFIVNQI